MNFFETTETITPCMFTKTAVNGGYLPKAIHPLDKRTYPTLYCSDEELQDITLKSLLKPHSPREIGILVQITSLSLYLRTEKYKDTKRTQPQWKLFSQFLLRSTSYAIYYFGYTSEIQKSIQEKASEGILTPDEWFNKNNIDKEKEEVLLRVDPIDRVRWNKQLM